MNKGRKNKKFKKNHLLVQKNHHQVRNLINLMKNQNLVHHHKIKRKITNY